MGDRDANQEITQRARAEAKRSPGSGGDEATDGRGFAVRWVQRQTLAMLGHNGLDIAEASACADGEHEIGRLVIEDTGQKLSGEDGVYLLGRVSQVQLRSAAYRRQFLIAGGGVGEEIGALLSA